MDIKKLNRKIVWTAVFVLIFVAICYLARKNAKNFEQATVRQTQQYLLTIARSQAQSIEEIINDIQGSLQMLAKNPVFRQSIAEEDLGNWYLERILFEHLTDKVNAVYRLDANGIVQSRVPFKAEIIGADFSYKPGVETVMENHEPYVSKVFKTNYGRKSVSICCPVFSGRRFIGIVRTLIYLEKIRNLVEHIGKDQKGYAWIIDNSGTLITHPETDYLGKGIIAISKDASPQYDWAELKNIVSRMTNGQEGVGSYHSVWRQDQRPQLLRELVAFAPIKTEHKAWSIAVSMGYDEIYEPIKTHTRNIFVTVEFLILSFIGVGAGCYKAYRKKTLLEARAKSAEQLRALNQQLESEIIERKRTEQKLRLLHSLIKAISESQDFDSALGIALRMVCEATDWSYGEAWIPMRNNTVLGCSPAWYSNDKNLDRFKKLSEKTVFLPNVGLPGRVWSSKHSEWNQDVSALPDTLFSRAGAAMETGLKASLGIPIIADDEVLAVLVFFMLDLHEEDKRMVELVSSVARQLGSVVQRKVAQRKLQQHVKQLNCFYGLSKLVEQPQISLEQIFQKTAYLIAEAYRHPDATCVRITFEGIQYKTDNFKKTELSQWAQIKLRSEKVGLIEVYYLGEKEVSSQSTFLEEELDLLKAVAEHLGRIAERHQAREKLGLFRNLIDRSNDCIFVIEPKWGRFLDVNDRACDSLGYTREELLDMTLKDIDQSIPDGSSWQKQTEELKLKGNIIIESRHKRKDSSTFFTETTLKLVSQHRQDYIIAVARDITERKKAEDAQTKLLEQVENVNRELKDFAYIISHDLKAPLRGVSTLAGWIAADYADKLDENGKEQINLLVGRVGRMYDLIDGVLEYSRVGRLKEEKVRVNLNELVPEVIDMIAPPDNIEITIANELPVVECEQTRVLQVFQNLLSNAVKYMDKPQGWIKIGCVEEAAFWEFSIADNGPGIEEKHFDRIFKIFQTLSSEKKSESTGVGLAVVKKIIDMYGGRIWVESEPGQGSTFFFTLSKQEMEVIDNAILQTNTVS